MFRRNLYRADCTAAHPTTTDTIYSPPRQTSGGELRGVTILYEKKSPRPNFHVRSIRNRIVFPSYPPPLINGTHTNRYCEPWCPKYSDTVSPYLLALRTLVVWDPGIKPMRPRALRPKLYM
jgi:hypothetical protein